MNPKEKDELYETLINDFRTGNAECLYKSSIMKELLNYMNSKKKTNFETKVS